MASRRGRHSPIAIFEDQFSDSASEEEGASEGEHDLYSLDQIESDAKHGSEDDDYTDGSSSSEEQHRVLEGDLLNDSDSIDAVKSIENPRDPSGSFSTTSGIHLDSQCDPHLDYVERTTPMLDENTADPFSRSLVTYGQDYEYRKVSESISTLPDELGYYRSPLPGRAPLATTTDQEYTRAKNTPSRNMPYPITHSRSNSAARHESRPLFRSPSSVRAIQMSSPPPFEPSPLSGCHQRHLTNGSVSGSPRIRQSYSPFVRHSPSGTPTRRVRQSASPSRQAPAKPNQEFPLVLLHCTLHLSPVPTSYPAEALEAVAASERIKRDAALLKQKLEPTVLERGVLVPHPGEDYELLEERILESLELKRPRVGACGHFRRSSNGTETQPTDSDTNDEKAAGEEDHVKCNDCAQHLSTRLLDASTQSRIRRWDIKVYAANGLMRAGAWSAAWREMEKVDVEVGVWLGDDDDKDLAVNLKEWTRKQEEAEVEASRMRDIDHAMAQEPGDFADIANHPRPHDTASIAATERPSTAASSSSRHNVPFAGTHTFITPSASAQTTQIPPKTASRAPTPPPAVPKPTVTSETPLTTLLLNYVQRQVSKHQRLALPILAVAASIYLVGAGHLQPSSKTETSAVDEMAVPSFVNTVVEVTDAAIPAVTPSTTTSIATVTETITASPSPSLNPDPTLMTGPVVDSGCACDCASPPEEDTVVVPRTEWERVNAAASLAGAQSGMCLPDAMNI